MDIWYLNAEWSVNENVGKKNMCGKDSLNVSISLGLHSAANFYFKLANSEYMLANIISSPIPCSTQISIGTAFC